MLITESTSTQQSQSTNEILLDRLIVDNNAILSIQQKKTLREYRIPEHKQPNENYSKIDENQIVEIDLDLNDETIDDQNSLPEIIFKRIIAPQRKYLLLQLIDSSSIILDPEKDKRVARRRISRKSRDHRSHLTKKIIQTEN